MPSVPFKVKKVINGWAESTGLLLFEPASDGDGGSAPRETGWRLNFQFQTKDAVLGLLKTGVKEVAVDLADVTEVTFIRGWLGGGTLTVKLADMKAAAKLPGQESGIVELKIARKDTDAARELASDVNLEAAEARLRKTMS